MNGHSSFESPSAHSQGRMTFKSAALISMLSRRALPKLDELDDNRYFSSSLTSKAGINPQTVRQKIIVTPKATNRVDANWWVQFEDAYLQRQFNRRIDDFSFRFDVTAIIFMAIYVFCYAFFDFIYMVTLKTTMYTGAMYGFRIATRILGGVVLILMSRWHWKKSIDRPKYTPWGTKWWLTRSNALVVDITIFFGALHVVNMLSGDVWSPTVQYRIFFEMIIALSMRPVEKLQAVLTVVVLGICIPLIWLLATMDTPTNMCGGLTSLNWDPQVAILPVITVVVPFVVERLCHYRLLFMALEFVQWRRLQVEELQCILKCGNQEYGVADRRRSVGGGGAGVEGNNGSNEAHGNGVVAIANSPNRNRTSPSSPNSPSSPSSPSSGSKYALQSPSNTNANSTKESRYVDALEHVDHTTPAELGIAHMHRVLDQLDMPKEYETLLRDAISIMRKGPKIYEPNIIEQLSRVVIGGKHQTNTLYNESTTKLLSFEQSNAETRTFRREILAQGSEALKKDHRERLVKTKTVRNMFELDHTHQHLETLDIDTQEMMKTFNTPSFNVFDYEKNPKQAFVAAGILVLNDHYMFQTFRLDELTVLRALQRFADIYNTPENVPYHSQLHGVDVAQLSHLYLLHLYKSSPGNVSREGCPLDAVHRFALIFGALVHDLGHPGVNNSFLCETASPMALRFNDVTVLEMFHVSSTFQVLSKPEFDIFSQLEHDERAKIRSVMIELILATDLADHFKSLKTIQSTLNVQSVDVLSYIKKNGTSHQSMLMGYVFPKELTGVEQSELGKLILKTADIGHPARDPWVHQEWSRRASEEFWRQGDRERRLGLAVNPMNDRNLTKSIAKGQMGFVSFLVAPTHLTLRIVMGAHKLSHLYENLKNNYQYWENINEQDAQKTKAVVPSTAAVATKTPVKESKTGSTPLKIYATKRPPLPQHPLETLQEE